MLPYRSILLALACGLSSPLAAQTFVPLGDLAGGTFNSRANAVSRNGSTVVGLGNGPEGLTAFRWTAAAGLQLLPNTPAGHRPGSANAVSDDGRTIVGMLASTPAPRAFAWRMDDRQVQATQQLPLLPGARRPNNIAYGISGDGRYAVGESHAPFTTTSNPDVQAALWDLSDPNSAIRGLGYLTPGGITWSAATGISGDASTIVGDGRGFEPGSESFRMARDATAMSALDEVNPDGWSIAQAVNFDGSVVVGHTRTRGYRWIAGELSFLNSLDPVSTPIIKGVSDDGSTVVGWFSLSGVGTACVWDAAGDVRPLADILSREFGVDLTGWNLGYATDVSGDGRTIVGWGTNPFGNSEAFIATIPAPSAAVGWAAFGMGLCCRTRRRVD